MASGRIAGPGESHGLGFARSVVDFLPAALVIAVLALPAAGWVFDLDPAPPVVGAREAAVRPPVPVTLGSAVEFPRLFDAYFGENYGFRRWLVRLYTWLAVVVLDRRPDENVPVIRGHDGWLYYTGDASLTYVEGRNPFTASELQAWRQAIEQRAGWLSRRAIRYLIVFAPAKESIYPEHLPRWVRPSTTGTRLDQLLHGLAGCPGVEVLDLRGALLAAKRQERGQLYRSTDSHWNAVGAHVAYSAMMDRLAGWFPATRPIPLSEYEIEWTAEPVGDLGRMVGLWRRVGRFPLLIPRVPSPVKKPAGSVGALDPPLVTERQPADIARAVVFRDSFGTALVPFLSEHFGRGVFIWDHAFDADAVERERPAVVIHEYAERFLSTIPPVNKGKMEPE